MPDNPLHDELTNTVGHKLKIAGLVLLGASVPIIVLLAVLRSVLQPITLQPAVQVFSLSMLAIIYEAMPFILLGALMSGMIEMFVSKQTLLRLIPKSALGQLVVGALAGVALPVCECGVIVVLRRLLRKGMPLKMALAYLLAAPIVNPVVIVSTFAAFRGKPEHLSMPLARLGVGVASAVAIAAVVTLILRKWSTDSLLTPDASHEDPHHHHHHGESPSTWRKISAACDHAVMEFMEVSRYLIAGAVIAALAQTLVPRETLIRFGHQPVLGVLGMMGMAVVLNLCSEADAFVAASFVATFSFAAKLAFLVLGPMLDLKLIVMYGMVFRRRLIVALVPTILIVVFAAVMAWFWLGPS
ncbi:MAG: permease [Planctomycetes bacterium]|nr:permease [Planctomycetota bacterium]